MQELMTAKCLDNLREQLREIQDIQRPANLKEIDKARQNGDLKENADYHAAREQQGFIDGKIAELKDLMARAVIVDPASLVHDRVRFGSSVKLEDEEGAKHCYTIVGSQESNPAKGLISFASPLAKALLGKGVDDEVEVLLPKGRSVFYVDEIWYEEW